MCHDERVACCLAEARVWWPQLHALRDLRFVAVAWFAVVVMLQLTDEVQLK